jgi:hypothetical protein
MVKAEQLLFGSQSTEVKNEKLALEQVSFRCWRSPDNHRNPDVSVCQGRLLNRRRDRNRRTWSNQHRDFEKGVDFAIRCPNPHIQPIRLSFW